jgi:hypothetical protein
MSDDKIRYDELTQEALRGVIRKVLEEVAKDGLPGDHHFFIAIDTQAEGVTLSSRLREQYPEEMTVVLQYQFWDMEVGEDGFEVKLSFNTLPEHLVIPYAAIKAFYDPSARFGLQFGAPGAANDQTREAGAVPAIVKSQEESGLAPDPALEQAIEQVIEAAENGGVAVPEPSDPADDNQVAEIVELDAFRKK